MDSSHSRNSQTPSSSGGQNLHPLNTHPTAHSHPHPHPHPHRHQLNPHQNQADELLDLLDQVGTRPRHECLTSPKSARTWRFGRVLIDRQDGSSFCPDVLWWPDVGHPCQRARQPSATRRNTARHGTTPYHTKRHTASNAMPLFNSIVFDSIVRRSLSGATI